MEETQLQFRTVTFGGFQKQDVLAYLETSAREQAEKLAALQREIDELRQGRNEAEDKAAGEEERLTVLEEENRRLSADLADREEKLVQAEAQRAELVARVEELTAQAEQLKGEVEKLAPAAAAYEGVKDRTAGIELEAHGRARAIEQEAHAKAKKTEVELERWFAKLQEAYGCLRGELDATVARAAGEVDQLNRSMEKISEVFSNQDAALKELEKKVKNISGPKAPLPLEEK